MTDKLPPNLLALFAPRPALRYLPPADHPPESRKTPRVDGVASFVPALQAKAERAEAAKIGEADPSDPEYERLPTESWLEKRDRGIIEKQAHQKWLVTDSFSSSYKPDEDPNIRGNAFRTLFVARLPYDAVVKDLEREFGRFGPIERVRIVADNGQSAKGKKGKSRGYGFVVYENDDDMKAAYKNTADLYIKGRRVLVDVERGRTVSGWKPRRFGGGLGGRGYTQEPKIKPSDRFGPPSGPGGFRGGGFRGGFDRGRGGGFRGGRGGGGFDRGGHDGGGYRGGRGGYDGGGRGVGYHGSGPPPNGAPAGPRSGGGYGGRSYDDRGGGSRNANYEPLPPRGGYRDRDSGGGPQGGGYSGQKRPYDGGGPDDRGPRRRY